MAIPETMPPGKVPREVTERILRMELSDEHKAQQLAAGNARFQALEKAIAEVDRKYAPRPFQTYKFIGASLGIISAFAGVIGYVMQLPTKTDLAELDMKHEQYQVSMERRLDKLEDRVRRLEVSMEVVRATMPKESGGDEKRRRR